MLRDSNTRGTEERNAGDQGSAAPEHMQPELVTAGSDQVSITTATNCEAQLPATQGTPGTPNKASSRATKPPDLVYAPECRICLSADGVESLIAPCTCAGTVTFVHRECLELWAVERRSLTCELCGAPYEPAVASRLQQLINEAPPLPDRPQPQRATVLPSFDRPPVALPEPPRLTLGNIAAYILAFFLLLFAVLYTTLWFRTVSANSWSLAFWRAMLVILPVYIFIRGVWDLYRFQVIRIPWGPHGSQAQQERLEALQQRQQWQAWQRQWAANEGDEEEGGLRAHHDYTRRSSSRRRRSRWSPGAAAYHNTVIAASGSTSSRALRRGASLGHTRTASGRHHYAASGDVLGGRDRGEPFLDGSIRRTVSGTSWPTPADAAWLAAVERARPLAERVRDAATASGGGGSGAGGAGGGDGRADASAAGRAHDTAAAEVEQQDASVCQVPLERTGGTRCNNHAADTSGDVETERNSMGSAPGQQQQQSLRMYASSPDAH